MPTTEHRLGFGMSVLDSVVAMSDGNPGAVSVMGKILARPNVGNGSFPSDSVMALIGLDVIGCYGSAIWELYKDECGEDVEKLVTTILERVGNGTGN